MIILFDHRYWSDSYTSCLTTTTTTTTTKKILSGFYTNVYTSFFTTSGYSLSYNYGYNWATTSSEINTIRSYCSASSIICVGGGDSTTVTLAACGNCLVVTSQTVQNVPVLDSGVWWYYTPGKSFGYSLSSSISQNSADTNTDSGAYRLSWHLESSGGWRLGESTSLYSTNVFKMVFISWFQFYALIFKKIKNLIDYFIKL